MTIIHAWVGLSAIGLLISLFLTRESWLDLQAVPNKVNGRRIAAISRMSREALRVTVHAAYLAIGIPLLDREADLSFFVAALMWGNLVLVINSLIDARSRFLLLQPRDAHGRFTKE